MHCLKTIHISWAIRYINANCITLCQTPWCTIFVEIKITPSLAGIVKYQILQNKALQFTEAIICKSNTTYWPESTMMSFERIILHIFWCLFRPKCLHSQNTASNFLCACAFSLFFSYKCVHRTTVSICKNIMQYLFFGK